MQIHWVASISAGCLHAAESLLRTARLADAGLATTLAQPAAALGDALEAAGIDQRTFFGHAVPLSVGVDSPRELAALALTKTVGQKRAANLVDLMAGGIASLMQTCAAAQPGLLDELALRAGPLRQQWEARGPGLLAAVGRLTEPGVMAERAEVVLVHPATGGGGTAYPASNSVVFEAVLANPHADLPEVVRLGWLLSTLNSDLPRYCDRIARPRLARLAALAMVPVVLTAAEEMELVGHGAHSLEAALSAWRPDDLRPHLPAMIANWWSTYCESQPRWQVALEALDQLDQSGAAA